jgi:hypothetical protein
MEVICLQDEVLYALIDKVLQRIKEKEQIKDDEWMSTDETMKMLRIKSKATLQKLRDSGQIGVSKTGKKNFITRCRQ